MPSILFLFFGLCLPQLAHAFEYDKFRKSDNIDDRREEFFADYIRGLENSRSFLIEVGERSQKNKFPMNCSVFEENSVYISALGDRLKNDKKELSSDFKELFAFPEWPGANVSKPALCEQQKRAWIAKAESSLIKVKEWREQGKTQFGKHLGLITQVKDMLEHIPEPKRLVNGGCHEALGKVQTRLMDLTNSLSLYKTTLEVFTEKLESRLRDGRDLSCAAIERVPSPEEPSADESSEQPAI